MTKYTQKIPVIGPEEQFYGYIVGLGVGTRNGADEWDSTLYAMFEYNGEKTVWVVPDSELFQELSKHLCGMAWYREKAPEDYGYNHKVWIEKRNGNWCVSLP